jgi:hypothetical protein
MKALSFGGHGYNHGISREKGLRDNQTKVSNGGEREREEEEEENST